MMHYDDLNPDENYIPTVWPNKDGEDPILISQMDTEHIRKAILFLQKKRERPLDNTPEYILALRVELIRRELNIP